MREEDSKPLEQITAVVENFISDTRSDLLVIRGRWGVGKTFFWQRLIEEARRRKCVGRKYYSYVSLFGVNSLDELKDTILISSVESNAGKPKQQLDALNSRIRVLANNLEKIPKLRDYTGGLIGALLHNYLEDTLVCFDDIERRGDDLALKEVFGLASLLKEQRNCKVLLVMNDESFNSSEQDQFKLHGEKIIDQTVRFSVTADEAFAYVFDPSFRHYEVIRESCLKLQIKNIRILQRVKRYVEDIAPHVRGAEREVVGELISSVVLFVWSYYDKEGDAPPPNFIVDYSPYSAYLEKKDGEEISPQVKRWQEVISSYRFVRDRELDKCLSAFVENGYLDKAEFLRVLAKRNEEASRGQKQEAYRAAWKIYRSSFDDNEKEFIENLAAAFRPNMEIMSLRDLQSVVSVLRGFDQNTQADAFVDEYLSVVDSMKAEWSADALYAFKEDALTSDLTDEYLVAKLRQVLSPEDLDKRSLAQVVRSLMPQQGWNEEDIIRLDSFTADDYYDFFKNERSGDLYYLVKKCLSFGKIQNGGRYKSIGEKAERALRRLGRESRINRRRVLTLYGIDVGAEPDQGPLNT